MNVKPPIAFLSLLGPSSLVDQWIPVVVYLSGGRRGTTERLAGESLRIGTGADCEIRPAIPGESPVAELHATLHRAGASYELAVEPEQTVWVNGERVGTAVLTSGDVLEIGSGGPVLRFRLYPASTHGYKTMAEAFADCVDCVHGEGGSRMGRACWFLGAMLKELATQTSLRFRSAVVVMLTLLVFSLVLLTHRSFELEQRLASEEIRVIGLAELLARAERQAIKPEDLVAVRAELEDHLTTTVQRLETLETQSGAGQRVIASAAQSIIFLQGAFGFTDAESDRPLRYVGLGPDGRPLRTPWGGPAFTLDGEGPVVEIHFTGTAFVASEDGLLLTNRHVALPWENETSVKTIVAQGFSPVMHRFIGYLPGAEEPFEVALVVAGDQVDLAVLCCTGASDPPPPLQLSQAPPRPGESVLLLGYPTGIQAVLARADKAFVEQLKNQEDIDFWGVAQRLAQAGQISPLASRGIVGQMTDAAVVYDAETTRGGSGGPVLGLNGEVVAINTAILSEFGGSNLGVPASYAHQLLTEARLKQTSQAES